MKKSWLSIFTKKVKFHFEEAYQSGRFESSFVCKTAPEFNNQISLISKSSMLRSWNIIDLKRLDSLLHWILDLSGDLFSSDDSGLDDEQNGGQEVEKGADEGQTERPWRKRSEFNTVECEDNYVFKSCFQLVINNLF